MTRGDKPPHSEKDLHESPSRRQMLVQLGLTAGAFSGLAVGARALYETPGYVRAGHAGDAIVRDFRLPRAAMPQMAIAKSSVVPETLTELAIGALGGMSRFISRGDVVAVKPNIGWDRLPAHGANTNPRVVATVVRLCFDAGAKAVIVTDASCNEARRSFQRSGIWKAAYDQGADVVLPGPHRFRNHRLRGELLDEWPVYTPLLEADKLINVPVAKHHNLSLYTGAMKNWYGALGGRRNRLHQNIHVSIADLATFLRPSLTVLDATRVLFRNGPQGGNLADARDVHQVIASVDEVAADTYGASLLGIPAEKIAYLRIGRERGLGQFLLDDVRFV